MKPNCLFILFGLSLIACGPPAPQEPLKSSNAATPVIVQPAADTEMTGESLYVLNCMICHKDTGKGGPAQIGGKKINAEDLTTDKMKKMTDDKLFGYINDGIEDEGMPAFKDKLKPEEIKAVIEHVRSLQK